MRPTLPALPALLALALASCMSPKKAPTEPVLVAAFDLAEGDVLDESSVQTARLPKGSAGTALRPEGLGPFLGQRLRVAVPKGGVLQASLLAEGDVRLGRLVQKRGRAVTLPLAGAEWVRAPDHIDVLATFTDPATNELMTITLLQNVLVLAVDGVRVLQRSPPLPTAPAVVASGKKPEASAPARLSLPVAVPSPLATRRVTMLLVPEEAELALHAATLGGLHLTLRNPEDINVQEERGRSTVNTLLTHERARALLNLRLSLEKAALPRADAEDDPLPYLPRRKAQGAP